MAERAARPKWFRRRRAGVRVDRSRDECFRPWSGGLMRLQSAIPAVLGPVESGTVAELTLALSPTDLANHLACPHLTTLDLEVAMGKRKAPHIPSTVTEALRQRGLAHETAYV